MFIETEHGSELGQLVDVNQFNTPINIDGFAQEQLISMLDMMVKIRLTEEIVGNAVEDNLVKTPCHLGIGQEAIPVGISLSMQKQDYVFGGHRSHSQYLSLGGDVNKLVAEIFGKVTGASSGMGGSMHLYAAEHGFHGSVPIVGATIPIAVGAAIAAKMDGKSAIAVCYFGDGACEEGVLHESLNLASSMDLPVLFVCENNLYSSHLDIRLRQPSDKVARFAEAHRIQNISIDGNDVAEVARQSSTLIKDMRENPRPAFIEAVTYRWRGHVGPDENIDVGVRRSRSELEAWKLRDPVKRLKEALINETDFTEADYEALHDKVHHEVEQALQLAIDADYPNETNLMDMVYKEETA